MIDMMVLEEFNEHPIIKALSLAQKKLLARIATLKEFDSGENLTIEDQRATKFFILLTGEVKIFKNDLHQKKMLSMPVIANEIIGELSFIENSSYSATVVATSPCKCLIISFNKLRRKENKLLHDKLIRLTFKKISHRLRHSTNVIVKKLHEQMELGRIATISILFITLYTLTLPLIAYIPPLKDFSTYYTVGFVMILSTITYLTLKHSVFPWSTFGITLKHWQKNFVLGILWSLPILPILILFKYILITILLPSDTSIFTFNKGFPIAFTGVEYYEKIILYIVFSVGQEFIIRSGVQASLYNFLIGSESRKAFISIVLSALLFATTHLHVSQGAALTAIPLGLYWGYQFYKTNSLISVAVSHIIIGIVGLFIIGYYHLF